LKGFGVMPSSSGRRWMYGIRRGAAGTVRFFEAMTSII
jgi:hypothetical protein